MQSKVPHWVELICGLQLISPGAFGSASFPREERSSAVGEFKLIVTQSERINFAHGRVQVAYSYRAEFSNYVLENGPGRQMRIHFP